MPRRSRSSTASSRPATSPRGPKPSQYTSAADNYGYSPWDHEEGRHQAAQHPGQRLRRRPRRLDRARRPARATPRSRWSRSEELHRPERPERQALRPVPPDDRHLPALPGRQRASSASCCQGKGATAHEHIDYTNIADLTFNAALLNSMHKIQRLKAPEGWPVLAPYAALLLGDETLKTIQKDTRNPEGGRSTCCAWRQQHKPEVEALVERLDGLAAHIGQANPAADALASWKTFLTAKIDEAEAIPHLLNALDTSFKLHVLRRERVQADGTGRPGNPEEDLGEGRGVLPARPEGAGCASVFATSGGQGRRSQGTAREAQGPGQEARTTWPT